MSTIPRLDFGLGPAAPTTAPGARPDSCAGAFVRVSPDEKRDLERSGVVFLASFERTVDGESGTKYECRVRCDKPIEVRRIESANPDPNAPPDVREVPMGLCESCSRLESYVRRMLRERLERSKR